MLDVARAPLAVAVVMLGVAALAHHPATYQTDVPQVAIRPVR